MKDRFIRLASRERGTDLSSFDGSAIETARQMAMAAVTIEVREDANEVRQRAAVEALLTEGLSDREIARWVKVSPSTVSAVRRDRANAIPSIKINA